MSRTPENLTLTQRIPEIQEALRNNNPFTPPRRGLNRTLYVLGTVLPPLRKRAEFAEAERLDNVNMGLGQELGDRLGLSKFEAFAFARAFQEGAVIAHRQTATGLTENVNQVVDDTLQRQNQYLRSLAFTVDNILTETQSDKFLSREDVYAWLASIQNAGRSVAEAMIAQTPVTENYLLEMVGLIKGARLVLEESGKYETPDLGVIGNLMETVDHVLYERESMPLRTSQRRGRRQTS